MEPPPHARRRRRLSSNGVIVHWPATANSTEIPNPRPERRRGCGAAFAGTFELATSLPISGHNDVWKTDRNPPLTGHFPDRRRPDRSGLDTSHKAVSGQCTSRRQCDLGCWLMQAGLSFLNLIATIHAIDVEIRRL